MTTITQRLTTALAAAITSIATLGATVGLASPAHAEPVAQKQPVVVGGVAAAQRYRAAQPAAADIQLGLRAGPAADMRAPSQQAQALSNEAAFKAASNQAGFMQYMSNEAAFKQLQSQALSNEAAFKQLQ